MAIEEMVGIGRDHPFGQVERLDEEEPPEIARRKLAVRLRIHRRCRRDVEQDEPRDTVWMVERHAMRDARAAIMRDNVEPVQPARGHCPALIALPTPPRIYPVRPTHRPVF